ncbi:hypothetical protein SESBI_33019 [Sesbania bispinosa]|nr:hypothetical protein SESBI_33019 [Sesbania bispinosa]
MNVSSEKVATVQRHWLSGEVQVRFATVVGGEDGAMHLDGDVWKGNAGEGSEFADGGHE